MSKNKHGRALQNIVKHPEIIGIDSSEIEKAEIEKELREGSRLVAETDVVFTLKNGAVILIEYKSNGEEREGEGRRTIKSSKWLVSEE
jgi:hypothetical protein